ncbi:hypothetical protein FA95DRAFT_95284 [Auriscalpium vulgare]|uniref:Uncharacterized protein n=1 Tax=Auriscalpium vulgare TaxID=40419 RepID=A0ACB8RPB1_9AGAM|nr:hypothetical protein FA95DRAFT_95284 [Auriscalpium vulgare]
MSPQRLRAVSLCLFLERSPSGQRCETCYYITWIKTRFAFPYLVFVAPGCWLFTSALGYSSGLPYRKYHSGVHNSQSLLFS